jgi:drug/metabolite transporter (DMT)-like permease
VSDADSKRTEAAHGAQALSRYAPALFVLLWSTGFIGSRFGANHAEPFTMTLLRMLLVLAILGFVCWHAKVQWPRTAREILHLGIAGISIHACYLCGILYAMRLGMPVSMTAIIAGIQPVLVAIVSYLLFSERLTRSQWAGMVLGLIGVMMVIVGKYGWHSADYSGKALAAAAMGLFGISMGTLYQKHFCWQQDLRSAAFVQYTATAVICVLGAVSVESMHVNWHAEFIGAIVWLACVLSLGAIGLLLYLIKQNAASRVSSLFFLTPSVTALLAWIIFDEALPTLSLLGMLVTALGVAMVAQIVRGKRIAA